jgi:hypothetical protein
MIRWLKRVKSRTAKASTRQFKSGKNTKKEKFREDGVLDAGLEYY